MNQENQGGSAIPRLELHTSWFSWLKFGTADVAELAQRVPAIGRAGLHFLCI
jgi:hypothetical protein